MWTIELVEGRDHPHKKEQKLVNVTKNGSTMLLLLGLCKSIFHIGLVVILDNGRAIIELKKGCVCISINKEKEVLSKIY